MENGEESGGCGELAYVGPLAAVFGKAVWQDLEHVEKAALQASHPTKQTSFLSYCKSNIPGTYACNLFTLHYLVILNGAMFYNTYILSCFQICCQMNGCTEYPVQWKSNSSLFFKFFFCLIK